MSAYQQITDLFEAKDFVKVLDKWEKISNVQFAKQYNILPNLLWICPPEIQKENLLKLLSEYLEEKSLFQFEGEEKFFQFYLDYCPPNQYFIEIERFLYCIDIAKRYCGEYKGIVAIDIDDWATHFHEKHFIHFLEFLSNNNQNLLIIFYIENDKYINEINHLLSIYFRIEVSYLKNPTIKERIESVFSALNQMGFELDVSAKRFLIESLDSIKTNLKYETSTVLSKFTKEFVYEWCSLNKKTKKISAKDVFIILCKKI